MAGPLIEMLQGLRARRQKRLAGWGGGGTPGMRDIISPLDSQSMMDRAQGVDISTAMPSTRMQTQFSEPMQESFASAQLPRPEASSTVVEQQMAPDEGPARRSPFMTAAGSNAVANPTQGSQCPGGVCPTRPPQMQQYPIEMSQGMPQGMQQSMPQAPQQQGLNPRDYGITLAPGEILTGVGPQQGGSTAAPAQGMPSQQAGVPMATAAPTTVAAAAPAADDQFANFQQSFNRFAEDPANATWVNHAKTAADQANVFLKLSQTAQHPSEKHWYRQAANQWGMEAMNGIKAAIMQSDAQQRRALVERGMNKDTLGGQTEEMINFLTANNPELGPDERAAVYVGKYRQLTGAPAYASEAEMLADPQFKTARSIAHASNIAGMAVNNAAAGGTPWGDAAARAAGADPAYSKAFAYYGSMPFEAAAQEIQTRLVPAYTRALTTANKSFAPEDRMTPAEVQNAAYLAGVTLQSHLYYAQQPEPEPEPAPQQEAAKPAPAKPMLPRGRTSNK
jgi:hypothetical protein